MDVCGDLKPRCLIFQQYIGVSSSFHLQCFNICFFTRFFHQMANAHRRRNQMNRVKVNGRWYNEEREIKEVVCRVYQGLLADPGGVEAQDRYFDV